MKHERYLKELFISLDSYVESHLKARGSIATIHTIHKACCHIRNAQDRARVARIATDILTLRRNPAWTESISKDVIAILFKWERNES